MNINIETRIYKEEQKLIERNNKIIEKVSSIKLFNSEKTIKEWLDETLDPDIHKVVNMEYLTGIPSDWRLRTKSNEHIGHQLSHWAKEYCLLKLKLD